MARKTNLGESVGCHPGPTRPAGAGSASSFPCVSSRGRSVFDARAFTRALLLFLLVLTVFLPATAQQTDRAKAVGHRLFCMCGCKQILVECNHVGCPMSAGMLKKLDAEIASGKSDDLILQSFVQEFGAEVVAEPPAKGFNWLAWIMPFAALGLGLMLVRAVINRWNRPIPALPVGPSLPPDVLERIRQESEEDQD